VSGREPVVFLVDDEESSLRATARLLNASGFSVRSFTSAARLLADVAADPEIPGCVIADLQMPGLDGLELQRALAAAGCLLPVVFLSGHGDIPSSVRAMRYGAEDFIQKTAPAEELLAAVRRALARNTQELAASTARRLLSERLESLTPREREVLLHVVRGRLNKQIAGDLGIAEKTIKVHRARVMQKLGVRTIADLVRLVLGRGA
jgi:RNA polymerase sigma factor (sigma-70 family)